jgi:hypothetical protein
MDEQTKKMSINERMEKSEGFCHEKPYLGDTSVSDDHDPILVIADLVQI